MLLIGTSPYLPRARNQAEAIDQAFRFRLAFMRRRCEIKRVHADQGRDGAVASLESHLAAAQSKAQEQQLARRSVEELLAELHAEAMQLCEGKAVQRAKQPARAWTFDELGITVNSKKRTNNKQVVVSIAEKKESFIGAECMKLIAKYDKALEHVRETYPTVSAPDDVKTQTAWKICKQLWELLMEPVDPARAPGTAQLPPLHLQEARAQQVQQVVEKFLQRLLDAGAGVGVVEVEGVAEKVSTNDGVVGSELLTPCGVTFKSRPKTNHGSSPAG
eukprot:jgi/Tetstr1/439243/TSEL_027685.t1